MVKESSRARAATLTQVISGPFRSLRAGRRRSVAEPYVSMAEPTAPLHLGPKPSAVVLAGGRGARFAGSDKGLILVGGRPLVKHVIERLLMQVRDIVIVANRHHAQYASYGHRVVSDALQGFEGPLAGIAAGLAAVETSHALIVPVDAARLPLDLAASLWRVHEERNGVPCMVHGADGIVPVCCLLAKSEQESIEAALAAGERSVIHWLRSRNAVEVDFRDWPVQFWSLNSPDELKRLESALKA